MVAEPFPYAYVGGHYYSRDTGERVTQKFIEQQLGISRRQVRKQAGRPLNKRPAHAGKMNEYNQQKRKYQAELAKQGTQKNLKEIAQDPEFKQLLRDSKQTDDIHKRINAWRKLGYRTHPREWYRQHYSGWEPDV